VDDLLLLAMGIARDALWHGVPNAPSPSTTWVLASSNVGGTNLAEIGEA
jgi:hypothetical protein